MRNLTIVPPAVGTSVIAPTLATAKVLGGKKIGTGSLQLWVNQPLVADVPKYPLLYLKEGNSYIPTADSSDALLPTEYKAELIADGWASATADAIAAKLDGTYTNESYLNVLTGSIFSASSSISILPRTLVELEEEASSSLHDELMRRLTKKARGLSGLGGAEESIAAIDARLNNIATWNDMLAFETDILADCEFIKLTGFTDKVPVCPGFVVLHVTYNHWDGTAFVVETYKYLVRWTNNTFDGPAGEGITIEFTDRIAFSTTPLSFGSYTKPKGSVKMGFTYTKPLLPWPDGGSRYVYIATCVDSFVYGVSTGGATGSQARAVFTNKWERVIGNNLYAVYSATHIAIGNFLLGLLPYGDSLQLKISKLLEYTAGITIDPALDLSEYRALLYAMCSGSQLMSYDGFEFPAVHVDYVGAGTKFCVYNAASVALGSILSVTGGEGHPIYIEDIVFDELLDESVTPATNVPLVICSRFAPQRYSTPVEVLSYKYMTGIEIKDKMASLKLQSADFPAEITDVMIDELATTSFCVMTVPYAAPSTLDWASSSFSSQQVRGTDIPPEYFPIGEDAEGGKVYFPDGLIELQASAMFEKTARTMDIFVPVPDVPIASGRSIVTVEFDYDTVTASYTQAGHTYDNDTLVGLVETDSPLVSIVPGNTLLAGAVDAQNVADGVAAPNFYALAQSHFRALNNMEDYEDTSGNPYQINRDLDYSAMDPRAYFSPVPAHTATGSILFMRRFKRSSLVDIAMTQRDLPEGGRRLLSMVMQPILWFINPL